VTSFFYVTYGENVHPTKKDAPMIKKRVLKTDRMRHISGGFRARELAMLRLYDFIPEHSTLGGENIESTKVYLHMDLKNKRKVQKIFFDYMQSILRHDPELDDLIDWENKKETLDWLDSL
jgi:transcription termination factor NusB